MYTYLIFPSQKLCVFTGRGDITFDEIRETARLMLSDSNWQTGWDLLYDLRDAYIVELNYKTSIRTSTIDRKYYDQVKGGKVAVVANRDVTFGVFRMYFSIASDRPQYVQIFRGIEEAIVFLDLDSTFVKQLGTT